MVIRGKSTSSIYSEAITGVYLASRASKDKATIARPPPRRRRKVAKRTRMLANSNWEPYAKTWYCRPELVEEYFEQQSEILPLSLPQQTGDTSDEDEPEASDGEESTQTFEGEPVGE
ncbi:hypothetical protein FGRMN_157 [Fusarium graminum]|nr:hypothetical protein FGRMN_157 [Fusarium graminum]